MYIEHFRKAILTSVLHMAGLWFSVHTGKYNHVNKYTWQKMYIFNIFG